VGFEEEHDIQLISSGLLGVHTISGEIGKKTIETLVLEGPTPIIIRKTDTSILWVFANRVYTRLIRNIQRMHKALEARYGTLIASWSGVTEDVLEIKEWLARRLGFEYSVGEEIAKEFEKVFGES